MLEKINVVTRGKGEEGSNSLRWGLEGKVRKEKRFKRKKRKEKRKKKKEKRKKKNPKNGRIKDDLTPTRNKACFVERSNNFSNMEIDGSVEGCEEKRKKKRKKKEKRKKKKEKRKKKKEKRKKN